MRDWERTFKDWSRPPPLSETRRIDNTIRVIQEVVQSSPALNRRQIHVFTQGSYRNRVNIRKDSDVDMGVMLHDVFLDEYPEGMSREDFGFSPANYSYRQFKDELGRALVSYFGASAVTRGNKAFNVKSVEGIVNADVVPFFEFRRYWQDRTYRAGVALDPDRGPTIVNFPERLLETWPITPLHYENGISKNAATYRRYKGGVRILKVLRSELEGRGNRVAGTIPGYLLECAAWNAPNNSYLFSTWMSRVRGVLSYLKDNTQSDAQCRTWCEVDNIKFLFHPSQPWTRSAVNQFATDALRFVEA